MTPQGRENTRRFFGAKSGKYVKGGLKFEYCPFCGVSHKLSEPQKKLDESPDGLGR
jgi:hypothetical protein